jgi:hypothetical protein
MATICVTTAVRLRWWVRPYMVALTWLVQATGMEPDWDKVNKVLRRGVVVKTGEATAHGNGRQKGT